MNIKKFKEQGCIWCCFDVLMFFAGLLAAAIITLVIYCASSGDARCILAPAQHAVHLTCPE